MKEFRGCFKEIAGAGPHGLMAVNGFLLMSAPNRYRKMGGPVLEPIDNRKLLGSLSAIESIENELVRSRQLADFPDIPNPVGMQWDLFDAYLAWLVEAE